MEEVYVLMERPWTHDNIYSVYSAKYKGEAVRDMLNGLSVDPGYERFTLIGPIKVDRHPTE